MMEAYFDESGIHDGAAVCAVGGFYGSQSEWRRFEAQWGTLLADYPEVKNAGGFHAKVFFGRDDKGNRLGPYKTWSDEKAHKFLERIVQAVIRNRIFPVGCAIVVQHFMDMPLIRRKWFTGAQFDKNGKPITSGSPKKPYYVPFQFSVLECIHTSKTTDKVHFYAGLDRTFSGYATELHKQLVIDPRIPDHYRNFIGGLSFPLAKDTPGLQAADLLVNRMYRHSSKVAQEQKTLPLPSLLNMLIKNRKPRQTFNLLTDKKLDGIVEKARSRQRRAESG
jgi:hypothetical protein